MVNSSLVTTFRGQWCGTTIVQAQTDILLSLDLLALLLEIVGVATTFAYGVWTPRIEGCGAPGYGRHHDDRGIS